MIHTKRTFVAVATAGMLLAGALGLAQSSTEPATPEQATPEQAAPRSHRAHRLAHPLALGIGAGAPHGLHGLHALHGLPLGRFAGGLALGTTVEVTLYDGDPDDGGQVRERLEFTYGEDSEVAFAERLAEARQDASWVTVDVGEQTRTVDLSTVSVPTDGRGLLPRELAAPVGLETGDTISAAFYDGDPEEGSTPVATLEFTYGEDSAAGFANDFAGAAGDAAYVVITTSARSFTFDLSAVPAQPASGMRFRAEPRGRR